MPSVWNIRRMDGPWEYSIPYHNISDVAPAILVGTNKPVSRSTCKRGLWHVYSSGRACSYCVRRGGYGPFHTLSLRVIRQSACPFSISSSPFTCTIGHTYCNRHYLVGSGPKTLEGRSTPKPLPLHAYCFDLITRTIRPVYVSIRYGSGYHLQTHTTG